MTSTPPAYVAAVAREVEKAIKDKGLTVLQVAESTLIPRVTLQRRLAGDPEGFRARELKLIATLLGCTVSEITAAAEAETAA